MKKLFFLLAAAMLAGSGPSLTLADDIGTTRAERIAEVYNELQLPGTIEKIDHTKGLITLSSVLGNVELSFPPADVRGLQNGDPVVVDTYAAQAKLLPKCATEAAQEFGAPVRVFQAMALAEQGKPGLNPSGGYGPMGFGKIAIPMAADGIGADIDAVKNDPCTNYRAAAWWLMRDVGDKTGDIWPAVTSYYYGKTDRARMPAVDLVKAIYKRIEG